MPVFLLLASVLFPGCEPAVFGDFRSDRLTGSRSVPAIPQDGLLAYYPFDGSLRNSVSSLHDGDNFGTTFTEDRLGNPASALHFDGIDDYVELGQSDSLQIPLPISLSYWIKPDQVETTFAVITTSYDVEANTGVFAAFDSRGGNPSFSIGSGGPKGRASRRTKHSAQRLEPGEWFHVVGVVESISEVTIYLNGVETSGWFSGSGYKLAYGDGPAALGRRVASVGGQPIYFSGSLDDVAVYSRALSEADVSGLYGTRGHPPQTRR
jgi:hypothetical protein